MRRIIVIGAGGQGREVEFVLRNINAVRDQYEFVGFVVSDLSDPGGTTSRERIVGDLEWLRSNRHRFDALALGVGMPETRRKLSDELEPDFDFSWWPALIDPSAVYDRETCSFAHGAFVAPGVVATVNVRFEPFAMANFGCTLGHETTLKRAAVVMPGASISGGVEIGEDALVGTGARVLQYRKVGRGAQVGAGAVVTKDVEPRLTVVGIPARPAS